MRKTESAVATLLMVWGLAGVQCSSEETTKGPPAEAIREGSRLALRSVEAEEIRQFLGLYDTELEEECTFRQTDEDDAGAIYYCLPHNTAWIAYDNPDCDGEPILLVDTYPCKEVGEGDFVMAYGMVEGSCGTLREPRIVGRPYEGNLFTRSSSGCIPRDPGSAPAHRAEPVDWDAFVSARLSASKGGVEPRFFEGSDGSRTLAGAYWEGEPCFPQEFADEVSRCVPGSARVVPARDFFSDDTCSTPVVYVGASCSTDAPARYLVESSDDPLCSRPARAFEAGEVAESLHKVAGDACEPHADNLPSDFRALGGEVELGVVSVREFGSARLRFVTPATSEGDVLTYGGRWFDTELDFECYPGPVGDGEHRCLPLTQAYKESFFSDADCTEDLYVGFSSSCEAAPEKLYFVESSGGGACDARADEVWELVPHEGDVYQLLGDTCESVAKDSLGYNLWAPKASVPLSDFAPMTLH